MNFTVVLGVGAKCLSVTGRNALDVRGALFVFDFADATTVSFTVKGLLARISASAAFPYMQTHNAQQAMRVVLLMQVVRFIAVYSQKEDLISNN